MLRHVKVRHWIRYLLTYDTTWHGQFQTLARLLRNTPPAERVVVDVGASDGFYSSNSYPFIKRGWRAILVEPHPVAFANASRLHRGNEAVKVLNMACGEKSEIGRLVVFRNDDGGSRSVLSSPARRHTGLGGSTEISVPVEPVAALLQRYQIPRTFGLLSVDTEGGDYQVLLGLDLSRFRPLVIITENCPNNTVKFEYLHEHGYRLHNQVEADTIWRQNAAISADEKVPALK